MCKLRQIYAQWSVNLKILHILGDHFLPTARIADQLARAGDHLPKSVTLNNPVHRHACAPGQTSGESIILRSLSELKQDAEQRLRAEIENNLSSGNWSGGKRLPTERVLSKTLETARARERRVLKGFERDGRITRSVGRGTFVKRQSSLQSISDEEIESTSMEDLIDIRLII